MKAWFYLHTRAAAQALWRLLQQPLGTLFSALVVGIALSLPAAGFLFLDNVTTVVRGVSSTPEISIFLTSEATSADVERLEGVLAADEDVGRHRFVAREDALRELERSGLGDVLGGLNENPLPDAFVLKPATDDPEAYEALRARLADHDVVEHAQLDSAWVERLHALLALGRSIVALLALLLGLALVIVTFNTIRLQILTQRHEIDVSRLLGATAPFIRRPFYWFGCLQGVLGGAVALGTVWVSVVALRAPVESVAATYGVMFRLAGPGLLESLAILAFAAWLGWLGSALSVRRHLTASLR